MRPAGRQQEGPIKSWKLQLNERACAGFNVLIPTRRFELEGNE